MIPRSIEHPARGGPQRAALLAMLVTALLAACGANASPSPTASPGHTDSAPTTVTSPGAPACASADIKATGGPWGGAAGSRGTDVSVQNVGASSCLLPARPSVSLVDPAGTALLASEPAPQGGGQTIGPGETLGFSLVFSNWCDQSVSLPLSLRLALADGAVEIDSLSVATADELPPCNGPGQPAALSTIEWQPR
jgi:hypothetical protein